jgi:hypothetical protein
MKRSRTRNLYVSPFPLWVDLAMKTGEMMTASAQVIGHRTRQMAAAGSKPNASDRREFALMGQEKIEAVAKSAHGMAAHMMTVDPLLGARAVQQTLAAATAMMSLAGSRTVSQALPGKRGSSARWPNPLARRRESPAHLRGSPSAVLRQFTRGQLRTPSGWANAEAE